MLSTLTNAFSNYWKAFNTASVRPLEQGVNFEDVEPNTVMIVKGQDQEVHWKDSKVTVIETSIEGNEQYTSLFNLPEGSLKLKPNWDLYIAGGKVVEEKR